MSRARNTATLLLAVATITGACQKPPEPPRAIEPVASAAETGWRRGVCGAEGWCWGYPRPQGLRVNRLWASGPGDLWAVGDSGVILRFDGTRWSRVPSGTNDALVAVAGRSRDDAWAVGRERTLLRLHDTRWSRWMPATDGGTAAHPPETGEFRDVAVLPNGEAWVVGGSERGTATDDDAAGTCLIGRFDAGAWLFDEDVACSPLLQVWGRAANDVWARGGADVVHWNGKVLTKNPRQKPAPLIGRHGVADGWRRLQIDWGSGTAGTLLHATHTPRPEQAPRARDFWAFGADDVWAIDGDGALAHFDGRTWQNGDVPLRIKGVAVRATTDVWAVADPSTLLHFDGRAWAASPIPGAAKVDPVAIGAAPHDLWVLTAHKILRFDGARWSELPATTALGQHKLSALLVLGADDVWLGAERMALHWNGHTLDTCETDFAVTALWGNSNEVWAGSPAHRWNGSAFVVPPELADVDKGKDGVWSGATGPGAVWLTHGGSIARLAAGRLETVGNQPVSLRAIWQSPSGDVWAVGSHIVHGVSDAAGSMTWTLEDSVGLTDMTEVGGSQNLIWVRGAQGILFRRQAVTP